jgi:hypothetical protein
MVAAGKSLWEGADVDFKTFLSQCRLQGQKKGIGETRKRKEDRVRGRRGGREKKKIR